MHLAEGLDLGQGERLQSGYLSGGAGPQGKCPPPTHQLDGSTLKVQLISFLADREERQKHLVESLQLGQGERPQSGHLGSRAGPQTAASIQFPPVTRRHLPQPLGRLQLRLSQLFHLQNSRGAILFVSRGKGTRV